MTQDSKISDTKGGFCFLLIGTVELLIVKHLLGIDSGHIPFYSVLIPFFRYPIWTWKMKDVPLSTQDSMGCGGNEGASPRPRSGDTSTRRSGASNRPRAKFRNPNLCWRVRDSDSERPCRPIENTESFRIRFDPKLYRFRFSSFGVLRVLFSSFLSGRKRNRMEFRNNSGIPVESSGI